MLTWIHASFARELATCVLGVLIPNAGAVKYQDHLNAQPHKRTCPRQWSQMNGCVYDEHGKLVRDERVQK